MWSTLRPYCLTICKGSLVICGEFEGRNSRKVTISFWIQSLDCAKEADLNGAIAKIRSVPFSYQWVQQVRWSDFCHKIHQSWWVDLLLVTTWEVKLLNRMLAFTCAVMTTHCHILKTLSLEKMFFNLLYLDWLCQIIHRLLASFPGPSCWYLHALGTKCNRFCCASQWNGDSGRCVHIV